MEAFFVRWSSGVPPEVGRPRLCLSVQVNDFNVTVFAEEQHVLRNHLVNATLELGELLVDKLALPIGRDKTIAMGSTPELAKKLAADLKALGARAEAGPRRLGLRFALCPAGGPSERPCRRCG